jgi:aldose sugar dehydrogenase
MPFAFLRAPTGIAMLLSLSAVACAQRDVRKIFEESCASCHGADLRGGSGAGLIQSHWRTVGTDARWAAVISGGAGEGAMPSFGETLSEQEIRGLVVFIREANERAESAGNPAPRRAETGLVSTREHDFRVETVAEGFEIPWSIAFLPDGRMLVTERKGTLRIIENGRLLPEPIAGVPEVVAQGQGGMMAVGVHPDYAENGWIYLGFSDPGPESNSKLTAVVRGRLRDARWVDQQTIYRAPQEFYTRANHHFGVRFVFEDGYLFFPIGDRGVQQQAQDLSRPNGKVHRLHDDGRIPQDNPFVGQSGALPSIWSYGHRNPQGLARHPATGELWSTEHGPRGGDELNLVKRGLNYGWPVVTHGINYNGTPITALTEAPGLEPPALHWTPSIAVSAIDFYRGDAFPRWRNNLLVSSLARQELRRLVIEDGKVTHEETILAGMGRIREAMVGPDGFIYLGLEGPGRVVRLVPAR